MFVLQLFSFHEVAADGHVILGEQLTIVKNPIEHLKMFMIIKFEIKIKQNKGFQYLVAVLLKEP